ATPPMRRADAGAAQTPLPACGRAPARAGAGSDGRSWPWTQPPRIMPPSATFRPASVVRFIVALTAVLTALIAAASAMAVELFESVWIALKLSLPAATGVPDSAT